jgi:hypothetical protein
MSDTKKGNWEDYVFAALRLALLRHPSYGTTGISITFHDDKAVVVETARSEKCKLPVDPYAPAAD